MSVSGQSDWAELISAANQVIRDNPLSDDDFRQAGYNDNLDEFFDIVSPEGEVTKFEEYEPWEIPRLPEEKKSVYENLLKASALDVDLNQRICHAQPAKYFIEGLKDSSLYLARVDEWSAGNECILCKELEKKLKKKLGKDYDLSHGVNLDSQDEVDFALIQLQADSVYGLSWTITENSEEAQNVARTRHGKENLVVIESTVRDVLAAYCLTKSSTWRCLMARVRYKVKKELKSQQVDMHDMRNLNTGMVIVVDSSRKTVGKYRSQDEIRLIFVSDNERIVTRTMEKDGKAQKRHFLVKRISLPTVINKVRIIRGEDGTLIRYIRQWLYIRYLLFKIRIVEWWRSRRRSIRCHNSEKG